MDSESGTRVFVKEPSHNGGWLLRAYLERWNWAFLEARDSLELHDVSVQAITVARNFYVNKAALHTLGIKKENYECVMDGDVIGVRFTLAKRPPPHTDTTRFVRSPEVDEFDNMLTFIGEYLGISESKNDLQYGTFEIVNDKENIPTSAS